MTLFLISFLAGVLTILAPCSITLLPIIIGGSSSTKSKIKPLIIVLSLAFSIIIFTLLLKGTSLLIDVEPRFWQIFSGLILLIFGLFSLFPNLWDFINVKLGFSKNSDQLLDKAVEDESWFGPVLLGFSLGPVFNGCSPTYAILVATILPQSFFEGLINLFAYVIGLSFVLLIIGYAGQGVVKKLRWAANPNGWFKKTIGILIILVGLMIIFGIDKQLETWFLQNNNLNNLINFEYDLLETR
jgi:cytochrome c biogenesis protein CcdA